MNEVIAAFQVIGSQSPLLENNLLSLGALNSSRSKASIPRLRQRDRQTDRETDRQSDREIDRQRDREKEIEGGNSYITNSWMCNSLMFSGYWLSKSLARKHPIKPWSFTDHNLRLHQDQKRAFTDWSGDTSRLDGEVPKWGKVWHDGDLLLSGT
jgi:hypothetical protein